MAKRMTSHMASAKAVAMLQNMAHSTPLHSTTVLAVRSCVSGSTSHASNGGFEPTLRCMGGSAAKIGGGF